MSLSPSKHRTLSRQPSSPSLAVGLPPALPESTIMTPSSSSRSLKRSRSRPRIRRGDVSSSATTSPNNTEDEGDNSLLSPSPSRSSFKELKDEETTPKRKVVGIIEGPKITVKSRQTLQSRLQAAAKIKKSKSTSENLQSSASFTQLVSLSRSSDITSSSTAVVPTVPSKDKVVVCVRIKPTQSPFAETAYEVSPNSLSLSDSHPNVQKRGGKAGREEEYTYTFDALLQSPSRTPDLYDARIAPLVDKAMNGYNSTIFAYGQTGSGKSFTMTGCQEELGIIPCAVDGVFDAITADPERAFLLRVSYIEIYNETLRDLLNFKKGTLRDDEKPAIHTSKGKVYVEPLVEEIVSTPQDVVELLERGNTQRKTGATDWNERSSRSHSVFTIVIESKPRDGDSDDDVRLSRLSLIDLAGSEKAVSDLERRGEGKHINRSLLALKTVINKLTDKKSGHIPYRDSKLTHLLENALGGDSNICVICTLSAEEEHSSETLETLKFAGTCSRVETKAKKNILMSSERALIRAKDKEIEFLKKRLEGIATTGSVPVEDVSSLVESVAAMEARKSKLTTQLAKLNTQILTSELPRSGSGLPIASPKPKRRRISDFTSLMGGTLGLGSPARPTSDRRAVSNVVRLTRVEEDDSVEVPQVDTQVFDNDRIILALRRGLATRDEQIAAKKKQVDLALAQIAELQVQLSSLQTASSEKDDQHETAMRESHAQLEVTRSDLVATINEKTRKIDQLEASILDLRKSREEVMLEGEGRLDTAKAQLLQAVEETEKVKTETRSAMAAIRLEMDQLREANQTLRKDKTDIETQRAKAVNDFENFQQTVMTRDSETISTLRDELAKSRKQAEQADVAVAHLRSQLQVRREADGDHAQQIHKLEELLRIETEGRKMAEADNRSFVDDMAVLRELREGEKNWKSEVRQLTSDKAALESQKEDSEKALAVERKKVEAAEVLTAKLEVDMRAVRQSAATSAGEAESLRADLNRVTESHRQELAKLQVELEDQQRLVSESAKNTAAIQVDLESTKKQLGERLKHDQDQAKATKNLETRIATLTATIATAELAKAEVEGEVSELKAAVLGHETEVGRLSAELERSRTTLSEQVDLIETLKAEVEGERRDKEAALESANKSSADRQAELEVARKEVKTLEAKLGEERGLTSELTGRIVALEGTLASRTEAHEKINGEMQDARKRYDDLKGQLSTMSIELEREKKDRVEADEKLKSVSMSTKEQTEHLATTKRELLGLQERYDQKATELSDTQKLIKAEQVKSQTALDEMEATKSALRETTAALDDALSEVTDLQRKVDTEEQDAKREAARAQEQLASQAKELTRLEERLVAETSAKVAVEAELRKSQAAHADEGGALAEAQREVTALKKEIEELKRVCADLQIQLDKEKEEAVAKREVSTKQLAESEAEAAMTKRALCDAEAKMKQATAQADQSAKELADLKASRAAADNSSIRRHSSGLAGTNSHLSMDNLRVQALRATSGGESPGAKDKLKTKESEEIDRLEKIVESQKVMIEDQRGKIKFWARELEQQREIVRLLTQESHNATPTGTSPGRFSPGHVKSRSVVVSKYDSPSREAGAGSGATAGSTKTKVSLPSSFTARNLALPTSPTPLPMHPSQYSNAMARKARRVTIEHDMDFLTESNKVNKAKAVFDSPDKYSKDMSVSDFQIEKEREEKVIKAYSLKRAAGRDRDRDSFMPSSTPKQRRP